MTKIVQLGGLRAGAGRPKGSGRFKEKTRPIRVPETLLPQVHDMLDYYITELATQKRQEYGMEIYQPSSKTSRPRPLFSSRVAAGFPSPADDYIEAKLDLNEYLVKHPAATFFVRVSGNSMIGAGIFENDILVVDRALKATHGKVVVAVINGELTVKRLNLSNGKVILEAENKDYPSLPIEEGMEFSIWGVVTNVVHAL